jgi:hypothetical protein
MEPMPNPDKLEVLDVIELTEPQDGIPAGNTGGLLELNDDDTAMVEIVSIPELDAVERIIFPPLSKLRRIGHVENDLPELRELTEPFGGIPAGTTATLLEYHPGKAKVEIVSIPELEPAERIIFIPFSKLRRIGHVRAKPHGIAA